MGKGIRITEIMVNSASIGGSPFARTLSGKIVSVSIRNMATSTDDLLIGWNEDPSTKNLLEQSESLGYGPYQEGQYLTGELKVAFNTNVNTAGNQALIIISTETEQEVC